MLRNFLLIVGVFIVAVAAQAPSHDAEAFHPGVAGAVTIDDLSGGFVRGGPIFNCSFAGQNDRSFTWCHQNGGFGSHYYYTWNCGPTSQFMTTQCPTGIDYNWGRWTPNLPYTASYRVCVYIPEDHAYTNAARYRVNHAGGQSLIVVNQQALLGWYSLGVFPFNSGTGSNLYLGDYTAEPQASRQIGYDAAQFVLDGGSCGSGNLPSDVDRDRIADVSDNCINSSNHDQANNDGDASGDACDPDDDNDSISDPADNCVYVPNSDQANNDGDAPGDACDPDDDNDSIGDPGDNCVLVPNADQVDFDSDLIGDACDLDDDDDGCEDAREQGMIPADGGDRNDHDKWDFFDVPVPALRAGDASGARDRVVGLNDVLAVLFYVGAIDEAGPNANGVDYDDDLNVNAMDDGIEYDRTPSSLPGKPWRSGPPDAVVSLTDVLVALAQVGHRCDSSP